MRALWIALLTSASAACELRSCAPRAGGGSPATVPIPTTPPMTVAAATSSAPAGSADVTTAPFDFATVTPLLAHALLVDVQRAMLAKDARAAADALKPIVDGGKLSGRDVDRARFLLGRLLQTAKDDDAADAAYASVSNSSPLVPHASLRRASIAAKRGKGDDALALLAVVPDAAPLSVDRHFVLGDVAAAKGDHKSAAEAYGAERKGPRAVEALIRYAEEVSALGTAGEPLALDAARGARRVRFEHPTSSLAPRAEEAEKKSRGLLAPAAAVGLGAPTGAEEATSAQAFFDAGKPKDALPVALRVLSVEKKGSEPWCRAALVIARAHERLRERGKASDAYGDVVAACSDEATHVTALYDGAKMALAAKQPDLARARFAAVEKDHPAHRLADDARLRGALTAIDHGDVPKGEAMLAALADDYPQGDMRAEALFRLALPRMKKGDWAGALPFLEKSLAFIPREEGYFVAGRVSYFFGRAKLETGAAEAGLLKLRAVIAEEPLSFSSIMAYARLCERSKAECENAKKALDQGIAFEPKGDLFDPRRPETTTFAFARGVELACVGESDLARKELAAAGLLSDATKDPEGQWLVAFVFAKAGDSKAAHGIPRARLTDWSRHFPGGKWRAAWEIAFPRAFAELVEPAAKAEGVPPTMVWAVMREESAFDPDAASPSAAYGLLQLIVPTATRYAKPLKLDSDAHALLRPAVNIPIGTAYLKKLRAEFPQNPSYAVPSYNAGEGATHRWLTPPLADSFDLWVESIPYDETRKYTKRVLASYYAYVALYEPARLEAELRAAAGN